MELSRLKILSGGWIFFVLIFLRIIQLQIIKHDYYKTLSQLSRIEPIVIDAPRGVIFDRNGIPVAYSMPSFRIFKTGRRLEKLGEVDKITALKVYEKSAGEFAVYSSIRKYASNSTSHITGYLLDGSGATGIEKIMDEYLKGYPGAVQFLVDANRVVVKEDVVVEPVKGKDVYLTIDSRLCGVALEELLKTPSKRGAFVMIDDKGELLAMVSSPSFDPNAFINNSGLKYSYLTSRSNPLFNRAVQGLYPPGSVFKIITAIAAIEKGFDINTGYICDGKVYLGKEFKCWKKHGRINNIFEAFENSCNTYFIKMGIYAGAENILDVARRLGVGRKFGVEIYGEVSDLLPAKFIYTAGDAANISIGQGAISTSLIHMVSIYSAILNGGYIFRPYIIKSTSDKSYSSKPHLIKKLNLESIDTVKKALLRVVENGTGYGAKISGYRIYGKTGTAQNPHGLDHAWFIAGIELNGRIYTAGCIVENAGFGATYAVPIVKKVFEEFIRIYGKA